MHIVSSYTDIWKIPNMFVKKKKKTRFAVKGWDRLFNTLLAGREFARKMKTC